MSTLRKPVLVRRRDFGDPKPLAPTFGLGLVQRATSPDGPLHWIPYRSDTLRIDVWSGWEQASTGPEYVIAVISWARRGEERRASDDECKTVTRAFGGGFRETPPSQAESAPFRYFRRLGVERMAS